MCKPDNKPTLAIVDTPGLFDTSLFDDKVKREISKCINMSAPEPHAILLVIKVGPLTAEDRDAMKKVEEIFGEDAWRYTIILFIHGDRVKTGFEQVIKDAGPELQEVLRKSGHRYQLFNNNKVNNRSQVLELLENVDELFEANRGEFYSSHTYVEVVKMLEQREGALRREYKKKLEEETKAIEMKYEKKTK
ncbi:GTPase IMAP family member 7-like [Nothobranchius furzeri]|uniref:GTPase IMAP family member 7-like n=1 Tax=Nothobranchius furzeri TaxID=105023 RepID=A0A9D3BGD2_NOTFU|nr:GTPase IMAP family member 7-like [Nothobranchius furzeri]